MEPSKNTSAFKSAITILRNDIVGGDKLELNKEAVTHLLVYIAQNKTFQVKTIASLGKIFVGSFSMDDFKELENISEDMDQSYLDLVKSLVSGGDGKDG